MEIVDAQKGCSNLRRLRATAVDLPSHQLETLSWKTLFHSPIKHTKVGACRLR